MSGRNRSSLRPANRFYVQEIGVADRRLTASARADRRFLTSFRAG